MICTEWSITNTSVRLLNHHIKITFWVLSVCPFQMSPTSWLRILCIIKRIKFFHLLDSRSHRRLFPKSTYWCLDWKSTLSRLLLLFPLQNRWRTQGTGVKKTAISLSSWWDLSPKRQFCIRCPETRTQEIRLSDDWIFTGSPGMKAVKTRLRTASFCSPVTPSDGENRVLGFTRRAQQDLRGLA